MTDQWTDRLSEYLDGELPAAEGRALEQHLAGCEACRTALEQLRAVVARATSLEDRPPARDLWSGIADRIGSGNAERRASGRRRALRLTLTVPQLAAAAVALMALSAGSVWLTRSPGSPRPLPAGLSALGAGSLVAPATVAEGTYESAIRDLQKVVEQGRGRLDSTTVRVLEQNLRIIDAAIAQSRRALAADPASQYLNDHLAGTMQQKLDLLRRAARLAAART